MRLLLLEAKRVANISVNVCFKPVKTILLQRWPSLKNGDDRLLSFCYDHFSAQVYKIMTEWFLYTDNCLMIALNCFRHGGAACDFILWCLWNDDLKDRVRSKNDSILYTYVQSGRSLIVQIAMKPGGRKLLDEIEKMLPSSLTCPESRQGGRKLLPNRRSQSESYES